MPKLELLSMVILKTTWRIPLPLLSTLTMKTIPITWNHFVRIPHHVDPHMEQLCRKVRKMSVASVQVQTENAGSNFGERGDSNNQKEYILSDVDDDTSVTNSEMTNGSERHLLRLQNDWVARSLTSIAPRYQSSAGECSVYSCLTQFTAPELLTGNNKWACDRCTKLQARAKRREGDDDNKSNGISEDKTDKVYSNASKQLLIFSPPAILTIHLKRFQQTMYNLRKVNRHVDFPKLLDFGSILFLHVTQHQQRQVRDQGDPLRPLRHRSTLRKAVRRALHRLRQGQTSRHNETGLF